jgi:hypothetical protein
MMHRYPSTVLLCEARIFAIEDNGDGSVSKKQYNRGIGSLFMTNVKPTCRYSSGSRMVGYSHFFLSAELEIGWLNGE